MASRPRRRRRSSGGAAALSTLTRTARTAGETMAKGAELGPAAGLTVALRLAQLAAAQGNPAALADPEFTRMVTEKMLAFGTAGSAMLTGWQRLAGLYAAGGQAQQRLALTALAAWTDMAAATLRPIHRTARSNAARLGRRRR